MQSGYRLLTYLDKNGQPRVGVAFGDRVIDAATLLGGSPVSMLAILRQWDGLHARLDQALKSASTYESVPLASLTLTAPILYPGAFFCAGANYWDHLEEMADFVKRTTGHAPSMIKAAEPWFFVKTTVGTIVGSNAPVRLPRFSTKVDWEAELGVVIARPTRNISERDALNAVAGYVIVNDLSARDHVKREGSPFIYDWIGQKCFDDAAPMGPWMTPAAYVADPQDLDIKLWVNGVLKQSSNTGKMVHGIAEQIAYLSRHVTLQPGDVIATGTPAGVGMPRSDFLKPGDVCEVEIEGLGRLVNTMVPDAAPMPSAEMEAADAR